MALFSYRVWIILHIKVVNSVEYIGGSEDDKEERSYKTSKPTYNDGSGLKFDDYIGDATSEDLLEWIR